MKAAYKCFIPLLNALTLLQLSTVVSICLHNSRAFLKCSQCDICVDSFTCTWDFILHATICKHIHMVCIKLNKYPCTCESIDLEKIPSNNCFCEASTSRTKALELCKQIETAVLNCTNVSAINNGMKHLHAALMH